MSMGRSGGQPGDGPVEAGGADRKRAADGGASGAVASPSEAESPAKPDTARFEGLANALFVEQYKANRTDILTAAQSAQRVFQFAVTAFVGLNSIGIGFILRTANLSVFDGYAIAVYYGVVVTVSMLVFSVTWFMEMLHLAQCGVFLRYLEDRVSAFFAARMPAGRDLYKESFDGRVLFSEAWARGEMNSNRFHYIDNSPYLYKMFFLIAVCALSAVTGEAFFINAALSDHLSTDRFAQPLALVSLNPLAVLPGALGGSASPHVALLLWVNLGLVLVIAGLVLGSLVSGGKTALNVLRASRAEEAAQRGLSGGGT